MKSRPSTASKVGLEASGRIQPLWLSTLDGRPSTRALLIRPAGGRERHHAAGLGVGYKIKERPRGAGPFAFAGFFERLGDVQAATVEQVEGTLQLQAVLRAAAGATQADRVQAVDAVDPRRHAERRHVLADPA